MKKYYALRAPDGKWVTCNLVNGMNVPALTDVLGQRYTWDSRWKIEGVRSQYEYAFGVTLEVVEIA